MKEQQPITRLENIRKAFNSQAVLTGVDHSMKIMREETFGPAIPVMPYKSFWYPY